MHTFREINLLLAKWRAKQRAQCDKTVKGNITRTKMSHCCTLKYGIWVVGVGIIKQKHSNARKHTHIHTTVSTHVIICTHRPWGTVPSLSLSLATVTSSGYGPVLFNFKHCLSLVPALSCSFLSTLLSHSLSVSQDPLLFVLSFSFSFFLQRTLQT